MCGSLRHPPAQGWPPPGAGLSTEGRSCTGTPYTCRFCGRISTSSRQQPTAAARRRHRCRLVLCRLHNRRPDSCNPQQHAEAGGGGGGGSRAREAQGAASSRRPPLLLAAGSSLAPAPCATAAHKLQAAQQSILNAMIHPARQCSCTVGGALWPARIDEAHGLPPCFSSRLPQLRRRLRRSATTAPFSPSPPSWRCIWGCCGCR